MKLKTKRPPTAEPGTLARHNVAASLDSMSDAASELTAGKQVLSAHIEGLERSLVAEQKAHEDDVEELTTNHAREVEKMKSDHAREVERLQATLAQTQADLKRAEDRISASQAKLARAKAEAEQGLETLKANR